jgi:predicted ester cyclase
MARDNRDLVRLAFRSLKSGDLEAVDELFHPEFVNHEAAQGRPDGPEGMKETATWLRATFENISFEEQGIVAEDDRVVIRILFKGTHRGELFGIPPTGQSFEIQQFHEYRIQDGKIAEHWACRDDLGMLRQLGVAPDRQLAG